MKSSLEPVIIILGACQPLGRTAAIAFANQGGRVVAIDEDPAALAVLCAANSERIETLAFENIEAEMPALLAAAWGAQKLDLVVNLMPLAQRRDITGQMRMLTAIVRSTLRGLVAGRGCLVNVVAQPTHALEFQAHGMLAAVQAAGASLGNELATKNVRVHCLSVGQVNTAQALDALLFLSSPAGRSLRSGVLEMDTPPICPPA